MCDTRSAPPVVALPQASQPVIGGVSSANTAVPVAAGSRRRRLWELEGHAFCPIIGVCLPLPLLRRLTAKALGTVPAHSDYEVHCMAVTECRRRSPLADAVQKDLDQRYALVIRATQPLKSTEALARWWDDCRDRAHEGRADLASALWAALTHPRCDYLLEQRILGEVHMLQHQVGTATRADLSRLEALQEENAILARELAGAQQRSQQQARHFGAQLEAQEASALRMRAELIQAQTRLQQLQEANDSLHAASPHLPERQALAQRNRELQEELRQTRLELRETREHREQERERADRAEHALALALAAGVDQPAKTGSLGETTRSEAHLPTRLEGCAVLCVGGRQASVPVYRELIEHRGARFLHHDGGTEDNSSQLDATLAAADLVICQSGCISHNAYWRVKDHCKRTGKRCVFVDQPSRSALERALGDIGWEMPPETARGV
ncbi:DUF2325 domain-containing protein [Hylemonella gracilis]|uniref:DUF2325 domain-containing protein n=1 Tax=Hylemonella gracilis ATCC 19624 TaxID=887062 RepID=F3KW04_9BURK|nr:DUF2325 domain-containing protein [Hylemonella gracilis]EGI76000.1 hypothetical protein HGR_13209 [Hylemonella gracilis ATCC 19624]